MIRVHYKFLLYTCIKEQLQKSNAMNCLIEYTEVKSFIQGLLDENKIMHAKYRNDCMN